MLSRSGSVEQAPTLADLDEDGVLEVICATATGDVIVVNGKTGKNFANFPVRTGDRVISPVAILPFPEDWESGEGGESGMPRLIVPSFGAPFSALTSLIFAQDLSRFRAEFSVVFADLRSILPKVSQFR